MNSLRLALSSNICEFILPIFSQVEVQRSCVWLVDVKLQILHIYSAFRFIQSQEFYKLDRRKFQNSIALFIKTILIDVIM